MLSDIFKAWMQDGMNESTRIMAPSGQLHDLARTVFNVPERPADYNPTVTEDGVHVCLVSGGLDSTVLYWQLMQESKLVEPIYIHIGQPYATKEMLALNAMDIEFIPLTSRINGFRKSRWQHIIPGRNAFFIALAAEQWPDMRVWIYMAALDGEMPAEGGDKSYRFFLQMNNLLRPLGKEVRLPLHNKVKTDLVKWAIANGYREPVQQTISCFDGVSGSRCGRCQSCLRTWIAFSNCGIALPFDAPPPIGARQYVDKYRSLMAQAWRKNDGSRYSKRRILETEAAFRRHDYSLSFLPADVENEFL